MLLAACMRGCAVWVRCACRLHCADAWWESTNAATDHHSQLSPVAGKAVMESHRLDLNGRKVQGKPMDDGVPAHTSKSTTQGGQQGGWIQASRADVSEGRGRAGALTQERVASERWYGGQVPD
jgi:hypothetical protein